MVEAIGSEKYSHGEYMRTVERRNKKIVLKVRRMITHVSTDTPIFIAGHRGMVGSAIFRQLKANGYKKIITADRKNLDLCRQNQVEKFFQQHRVEWIVLAAARVGGIHANNTHPAEFIYQNMMIAANVINAAYTANVRKLVYLGSSCAYPKECPQPMTENALMTGPLEPTNEPYAVAKIAGIKLCESYNRQYQTDYRCLMPTNLYGEGDYFHTENAHVIPALLARFADSIESNAPSIRIWGTGAPKREFLHVDDLARACLTVMNTDCAAWGHLTHPQCTHVNVGTGKDIRIKTLAYMLAEISGYQGDIVFDLSKPDGSLEKVVDISRIRSLGWEPEIKFCDGLKATWAWYMKQREKNQVRC